MIEETTTPKDPSKGKNSKNNSLIVHRNIADSKSILELIENVKKIRKKKLIFDSSGKKMKNKGSKSKSKIQNLSKKKRDSDDFLIKKSKIFQSYDNIMKAPVKAKFNPKGNLSQFNTFSQIIQGFPFSGNTQQQKKFQSVNKNNSRVMAQSKNKNSASKSKKSHGRLRRKKNINLKNFFVGEKSRKIRFSKKKGGKKKKLRKALKDIVGENNEEHSLSVNLKHLAKQAKFLKQFAKNKTPINNNKAKTIMKSSSKKLNSKLKLSQNIEFSKSKRKRRPRRQNRSSSKKSKSKLRLKNTRKLVSKFNALKKENLLLRKVLKKTLVYLSKSNMKEKVS